MGGGCVETLRLIMQRHNCDFGCDLPAEMVGMLAYGA